MDTVAYQAVKANDYRKLAKRIREVETSFPINMAALNGAGLTMLHVACYQGSVECARVLLEVGKANAHAMGRDNMTTPLHLAALSGNHQLVKLLLQYQGKVNAQDSAGKAALHYAAVGGHLESIRLLLAAGASSKVSDNNGRRPCDYALEKQQGEAAELLMNQEQMDEREDVGMGNTGDVHLTFERLDLRAQKVKELQDARYEERRLRQEADRRRRKEEEDRERKDAESQWRNGLRGGGGGGGGGNGGKFDFVDDPWKDMKVPKVDPKKQAPRDLRQWDKGDDKRGRPGGGGGGGGGGGARGSDDSPKMVDVNGNAVDDDGGGGKGNDPFKAKEFLDKQLAGIVGMEGVKNMLRSLCRKMAVDQQRAKYGFQNEQNLNMLFLGNPGTGKTSMARVVAGLLRYMGVLSKGHLVEVCRKDLVAEYSGQSATRTVAKCEEAMGGVLFVDEAYSLKHEGAKDSFGQEVVDTLVAEMENRRKGLVVIMAGYTKEMSDFFRTNSGLQSRFPHTFEFANYSYPEMADIFKGMAEARKLKVKVERDRLVPLITEAIPRSVAAKGNARAVRNLLEKVLAQQTDRVADKGTVSMESLLSLTEEDFKPYESEGDKKGGIGGGGGKDGVDGVLEQLDRVVGIKGVKDLVRSLRAKLTIAEERKAMGLPAEGVSSLHMVFEGNPGTGKTTIARLMAEMFKALKLITGGHLIEVSRPDLVGEHVGETAPKTRRVVESAIGGVLFVDEAYALVGDGKDSFGREALETIMKCMEDMRDELIVILAGYPVQMKQLMQTNPGLKSRFQHSVNFPDYSGGELYEIALQMLAPKGLELAPDAELRLRELCYLQAELNDPQSGNARFVRNLLDVAGMRQAERLLKMEARTREALITIEREDLDAKEEDFKKSMAGIVLNKTIFEGSAEHARARQLQPPPEGKCAVKTKDEDSDSAWGDEDDDDMRTDTIRSDDVSEPWPPGR